MALPLQHPELPQRRPAPNPRPALRVVPGVPSSRRPPRRRRARLLGPVLALGLVVGGGVARSLPWGAGEPARVPVRVVVEEGDTVWGLAERHGPKGSDVRATVAAIVAHNDVDGVMLLPGDVIEVP